MFSCFTNSLVIFSSRKVVYIDEINGNVCDFYVGSTALIRCAVKDEFKEILLFNIACQSLLFLYYCLSLL